jgi:hypothetical protein
MTSGQAPDPVWISLLEVQEVQSLSQAGLAQGAYVNALSAGASPPDAVHRMRSALLQLGWKVIGVDETELFANRIAAYEVDEELFELAEEAARSGVPQFGPFYVWESDE